MDIDAMQIRLNRQERQIGDLNERVANLELKLSGETSPPDHEPEEVQPVVDVTDEEATAAAAAAAKDDGA